DSMNIALNYIDGQWLTADPSRTGDSFNPATGEVAARFVNVTVGETEQAIAAARDSFEGSSWAQQPKLRSDVLRLFADRLEERKGAIVDSLVTLNGKLKREAEGELQ